ncbi:MAG: endonuclease/exonuclease/phosphatase family protein [Chitinophagales bacterium]
MKTILAIIGLVLIIGNGRLSGQEVTTSEAKTTADTTLKILSWNIHCLPVMAYVNGKRKRGEQIGKKMMEEDFDIIVFQEAFNHGARRRIRRETRSEYKWRVGPANARYITIRANSGIWMISKIPVKKVDNIKFREKATADDKMARKGALMIEGEKNGQKFQVIGTHLNAGGPIEVRHSQVTQIREELLDPYMKKGVPQFICGDMNMRKESDNYDFMLKTYDAVDGALEVSEAMRTTCFDKNDRLFRDDVIDFIFYRANGVKPVSIQRSVPCFQQQWNKKGEEWLSDHPPMVIEVDF